jgi:predicted O-methyltransferase YrrM
MQYQTAQQIEAEIAAFVHLLVSEGVRSYLEIGSKWGGSLWRVANALPAGSRIVSVDLPWGKRETEPHLVACYQALKEKGYDTHLFLGDSTSETMIEEVRALSPFDAVFIDANHTEPYVRQDWANYGPMGKIVAFHDINWKPRPQPSSKLPIDVPKVWNEIKAGFRCEEIVFDARDNGIGVLWRTES